MALLHWRKFVFFDEELIKDTELNQLVSLDEAQGTSNLGQSFVTVKLTCSSAGRGCILLGDTNGYVYLVSKQLRVNSLRANQKITSIVRQVPKSSIFITCGSDQDGTNPLIKLWDTDKPDRLNQPTCIRVIRANSGFMSPADVTCIECNDHLTIMAIGYDDGSIVIFHGDITRQRRSKKSGPIKISKKRITGIVIRGETRVNQTVKLTSGGTLTQNISQIETTAFISTEDEIYHANLFEKSFSKVLLDQAGCKERCSCLLPNSGNLSSSENLFAVGRNNAVYFYQVDGRGPCLAFEGEKLILYKFKSYLVIVSRDLPSKATQPNPFRIKREITNDLESVSKRVDLNIYDIKNKYIAHSSRIPEVQEIFSEWGHLFVICTNGRIILFREKDTQTRLETLFKKNQFSLVIDLAKSHQYNEDALTEIFKHYGDHLYRKGDYDGAVTQYIRTIGCSEPSYVIKKFLDSKRISNLTVYLEALHQKAQASQDHTKLLLNCYSKMRNDEQLKHFIESYEEGNIKLDVDIAIKVLREAGFHEFAIYLASKHKKHELFFKLQIEDGDNSDAALDFMNEMTDPSEMAHYMRKYGRTMLKNSPEKTISMISTICQRSRDKISQGPSRFDLRHITVQVYPEEFFHIFVDNNNLFLKLLEELVKGGTDFATKAVHNLLLELYLNAWRKEKDDILRNLHADKIKKLLAHAMDKFDLYQALILCRNNRFDDGLIELYSRAKLYHLVLQYYIDQDDSLKIMKTCEDFGPEDSRLYMPALIHYSKTGDERLSQLLKIIEHEKIVPPMVVIKILSDSKRASLGSVKDYLIRFLGKLNDRYLDNENAIDHYKDDTEIVRQKIEDFENHQTVFQPSKCSACQGILDLPSVHFLCNHSYHQNCFYNYSAENDECPICVSTNRKLLDEIGSHETSKSSIDRLEKQFSTPNDDVFNNLAKLYGYGFFK